MIRHMDEGIGRILDALAATGAAGDTLVVFTSDNGAERFSDSWPFVGHKMDLLEGGIRVPLIARWPAMIRPGGVTGQVADHDGLGRDVPRRRGRRAASRLSAGRDEPPARSRRPGSVTERDLFWRMKHRRQRAVRSGSWKYLAMDGHEYLYDLSRDARERANLGRRYPERFGDLKARYEAWEATMPPVPEDAAVSLVYGDADIPNPTG